MLIHVDIRDLAVVQSLDLGFSAGLSVLTGETGAGKSILLTALGLALGDRADPAFIRPGAQRAEINVSFDLVDSPVAKQWLEDQDYADGDECVVRRVIAQDGRSRAYINGRPVTLQSLQDLGQGLVEIHGQHAHVQLIKATEQRRLLDAAAANADLLADVQRLYREWRSLRDELDRRSNSAGDQSARMGLLDFQIEELEQHDIASLNYGAIVEEHTRQANVGRILEVGQVHLDALYDAEHHAVNALLSRAVQALTELSRFAQGLSPTIDLLRDAQVQVKEAATMLRHELERLDVDPGRLSALDQRLSDVQQLARKHHVRPEALPEHLVSLRAERSAMADGAESLEGLRESLAKSADDYRQRAQQLTARRQATAQVLQSRITEIIQELGMPQGNLLIAVQTDTEKEPSPFGFDQVDFLVSANPGMPPRPVGRIASGGELSRISLAVQVAATDSKVAPTLIFDEVDSGISGGIAEIVGQKLRLLGRDRQVFCVTHLPQVAAQGHQHLLVEKRGDEGVTHSSVRPLAGPERIPEIARMLGGVKVTEQSLAHAAEMLTLAAAQP
jgi:DNA repair protein RecN (Recombination protein N)